MAPLRRRLHGHCPAACSFGALPGRLPPVLPAQEVMPTQALHPVLPGKIVMRNQAVSPILPAQEVMPTRLGAWARAQMEGGVSASAVDPSGGTQPYGSAGSVSHWQVQPGDTVTEPPDSGCQLLGHCILREVHPHEVAMAGMVSDPYDSGVAADVAQSRVDSRST